MGNGENKDFDMVEDDSDLHTDTNAPEDAQQGSIADRDEEGTAPARDEAGDEGEPKQEVDTQAGEEKEK